MNDAQLDKQLQQQIASLPKEVLPSRDLWAGIDHAIETGEQRHGKSSWQKLTVVAAGVATFGWLSWLTVNMNNVAFDPQLSESGHMVAAQLNDRTVPFVEAMAQSHEAQKQALLVQYDANQSMVGDWQKQVEELDKAADAIKKALVLDPSNAQLIKMLQNTYQQQLDLIEMVNRSPWQQI